MKSIAFLSVHCKQLIWTIHILIENIIFIKYSKNATEAFLFVVAKKSIYGLSTFFNSNPKLLTDGITATGNIV